jgi:hypothetical protein
VGAHSAKHPAAPLLTLLWDRLRRLAQRFAALAARAQAGTLRPPRRRTAKPRQRPPNPNRLPQGFGWLVRLVQETACQGSQLNHLLQTDPEMQALLKAAPQAARLLRPLCRMLAVRPDPGIIPPLPKRPPRKPRGQAKPPDLGPQRTEPYRRRPRRAPPPGTVWVRWRDIWMPETIRSEKPA